MRGHKQRLLIGVIVIAALPLLGQVPVSAARAVSSAATVAAHTPDVHHAPVSSHAASLSAEKLGPRASRNKQPIVRRGVFAPRLLGTSDVNARVVGGQEAQRRSPNAATHVAMPLTTPPPPDTLSGFAGASQASDIHSFGTGQKTGDPNEDIAVGPNDIVEVVNSSIVIFNRSGKTLGSNDLSDFMDVGPGFSASEPRVLFDTATGRYWVTVAAVPNSGCAAGPVLIAVSASSNPLPFTSWHVFALPIETSGTTYTDEPGLGGDTNTIVVTFDDFACNVDFLGSEIDFLQKSDFENGTGTNALDAFTFTEFAPQPAEAYTTAGFNTNYVVTNESDCEVVVCANPEAEVDAYQGSPEGGGVFVQQYFVAMTPTAVNNSTGVLPSAAQPAPGPELQTNDDRFLNAVLTPNGEIWTADGTSCEPSGDTVQRACMDFLEITVGNGGSTPTLGLQVNNVGVDGASLFYPAVAVDDAGDMITVFDKSSTTMDPSIMDADIPAGGTTLTSFNTLHTSSTYFDGSDLVPGACNGLGCRWGDYSGAAEDQAENGNDIWVVSGSEDDTIEGPCVAHACWNTRIYQLTLTGPQISTMSPGFGPMSGGETVTVTGHDFASDTTFSAELGGGQTLPIPIDIISPELVTFVTPPAATVSDFLDMGAFDSLGGGGGANLYQYLSLASYVPLSPFRILDTRATGGGGALGPGAIRFVQVSGVGPTPVPDDATAFVLNITEVNGTAASLLTVYSPGPSSRPNASNLNFAAHTVIANLVTVATPQGGAIDIYNALGTVNVLVDVEGYFEPQASTDYEGLFHPIAPFRVCDTRLSSPTPFCSAHGAMGPEMAMAVNVTGASQIPTDGTAGSVVVNLTGVAGSAATYLSLFPTDSSGGCQYTGSHAPPFSSMNLTAGAVQANRVMVELGPATTGGPDTSLCVYNAAGTINVLIDANGWFGSSTATSSPQGYQYQGIESTRICDTRVSMPPCPAGAIGPALSRLTPVAGASLIPASGSGTTVVAIVANLTAVAPTATTFLTLYPANLTHRPQASDVNLNAGVVLPNLVVVQIDTTGDANDGDVYLYNSAGSVNAIIDIEGWFQ